MQVGLIGAETSGKTTLFELLTNTPGAFLSPEKAHAATVDVPDERLDQLSTLYQPAKTTHAQISVTDIHHLTPGDHENNAKTLEHLKLMDTLALVVNGFMPERNARTLLAELEFMLTELKLSDRGQIERKQERIHKAAAKPVQLAGMPEEEVFKKLSATLEANALLSLLELPKDVWKELHAYNFLTIKPIFVVVNLSEEYGQTGPPGLEDFISQTTKLGLSVVRIYSKLEKDFKELSDADRKLFAAEYPFPLEGQAAFIQQAYQTANLIRFYTANKNEVHAWAVQQGCLVREAAGLIHKDFMNYFVRAEVIPWDRLVACGSEHEASKRGWLRSEKKDYPVKDGDVIHILATK